MESVRLFFYFLLLFFFESVCLLSTVFAMRKHHSAMLLESGINLPLMMAVSLWLSLVSHLDATFFFAPLGFVI